MGRKRQKIEIITNGTYKDTTVKIDGNPIYFETIYITGDKEGDIDILLGLAMSKRAREEIKHEQLSPAIGGFINEDDEHYE